MVEEKEAKIICRGAGLFDFISAENNYTVDIINGTCTCKRFFYTKIECKHISIARQFKSCSGEIQGKIKGDSFTEKSA